MKIWEVHANLGLGPIRTTPDGDADVAGLLLSERAYLLVMRQMRPQELVDLVERVGAEAAMEALLERFAGQELDGTGRGLAVGRTRLGELVLRRNDEAVVRASAGGWAP
ncbi:hypothetical protein [Tepidiforma sp.]|uniref:hypothetical protein n=1 Tax=Tepidiforma sp. TaxID=2682230 RepID=UPI002ADD62B3|nr:hypothetical protein [Tepidiforma sp.]